MSRLDQDIQGRPWAPCPSCPRRAEHGGDGSEDVCPSRRHRPFCDHVEADPATWTPLVRAQPLEDRPPRVEVTAAPPLPDPLAPRPQRAALAPVAPLDLAALRACPHAEDTPPRFGACGSCRTRECRLGGLHEVDLATCLECDQWRPLAPTAPA